MLLCSGSQLGAQRDEVEPAGGRGLTAGPWRTAPVLASKRDPWHGQS